MFIHPTLGKLNSPTNLYVDGMISLSTTIFPVRSRSKIHQLVTPRPAKLKKLVVSALASVVNLSTRCFKASVFPLSINIQGKQVETQKQMKLQSLHVASGWIFWSKSTSYCGFAPDVRNPDVPWSNFEAFTFGSAGLRYGHLKLFQTSDTNLIILSHGCLFQRASNDVTGVHTKKLNHLATRQRASLWQGTV